MRRAPCAVSATGLALSVAVAAWVWPAAAVASVDRVSTTAARTAPATTATETAMRRSRRDRVGVDRSNGDGPVPEFDSVILPSARYRVRPGIEQLPAGEHFQLRPRPSFLPAQRDQFLPVAIDRHAVVDHGHEVDAADSISSDRRRDGGFGLREHRRRVEL